MAFNTANGQFWVDAKTPADWEALAIHLGFERAPADPDYSTGQVTVYNTFTAINQSGHIDTSPIDQATCNQYLSSNTTSVAPAQLSRKMGKIGAQASAPVQGGVLSIPLTKQEADAIRAQSRH